MSDPAARIPVIDVGPLVRFEPADGAASAIDRACRDHGFFYAVGHGVDPALERRLEEESKRFFARPTAEKLALEMRRGGRAWRGYFPVGAELTSGKPDQKEGLYFGAELPLDHPAVLRGTPLHGPNLFPAGTGLREAVLDTIDAMTTLGHALMEGVAMALGLERTWFRMHCTAEPLVLFRIFNYPALSPENAGAWSVGEHTDYGLLTMLRQDDTGGLQVKTRSGWIDAPPVPDSYVCNIGDMLDLMTGGCYRSTPHRVRNPSTRARLSFPFFFDPGFEAEVRPLPLRDEAPARDADRWDGEDVHAFRGTYGDYLLRKVSKVFPELRRDVL